MLTINTKCYLKRITSTEAGGLYTCRRYECKLFELLFRMTNRRRKT